MISVVLTLSQFRNSICLGILNELLFSFFFFFLGGGIETGEFSVWEEGNGGKRRW